MRSVFLSLISLFGASIGCALSAQTTINQAGRVPAGTAFRVTTIDPIDVHSAQPGAKLRGSLADPVKSNAGDILIPRGAPVQLRVVNVTRAGRIRGRDRIDLAVDSITFNGQSRQVVSTIAESRAGRKGSRTLHRTGIGAAAGAVIGGVAGGGTGALVGSLVGGGGGTAVAAATGGKHLTIPPETMFTFQLQSPLRVK
jgi:hypothetical protein